MITIITCITNINRNHQHHHHHQHHQDHYHHHYHQDGHLRLIADAFLIPGEDVHLEFRTGGQVLNLKLVRGVMYVENANWKYIY